MEQLARRHGTAVPYTDASGLTPRRSVLPAIFGSGYLSDPSLWAYHRRDRQGARRWRRWRKEAAGQCQNESSIIHLKAIASEAQAPGGNWTALTPSGGLHGLLLPNPTLTLHAVRGAGVASKAPPRLRRVGSRLRRAHRCSHHAAALAVLAHAPILRDHHWRLSLNRIRDARDGGRDSVRSSCRSDRDPALSGRRDQSIANASAQGVRPSLYAGGQSLFDSSSNAILRSS